MKTSYKALFIEKKKLLRAEMSAGNFACENRIELLYSARLKYIRSNRPTKRYRNLCCFFLSGVALSHIASDQDLVADDSRGLNLFTYSSLVIEIH